MIIFRYIYMGDSGYERARDRISAERMAAVGRDRLEQFGYGPTVPQKDRLVAWINIPEPEKPELWTLLVERDKEMLCAYCPAAGDEADEVWKYDPLGLTRAGGGKRKRRTRRNKKYNKKSKKHHKKRSYKKGAKKHHKKTH